MEIKMDYNITRNNLKRFLSAMADLDGRDFEYAFLDKYLEPTEGITLNARELKILLAILNLSEGFNFENNVNEV